MPAAASSGVVVTGFSGHEATLIGGCLTLSYEQNFWPSA
jgi:hypothetical protein